jgi:hypothetical protein
MERKKCILKTGTKQNKRYTVHMYGTTTMKSPHIINDYANSKIKLKPPNTTGLWRFRLLFS